MAGARRKLATPFPSGSYFNYPVNPNTLKERLAVEIEGKAADYTLQTLSADTKYRCASST